MSFSAENAFCRCWPRTTSPSTEKLNAKSRPPGHRDFRRPTGDCRQSTRCKPCHHKFNLRPHYLRHERPLHLVHRFNATRESLMTPQERQLVDDLFDRLGTTASAPRDPEAVAAIAQGLRKAPNAVYALVQTVLVQDEALRRANSRIQELEGTGAPQQAQGGGFLDAMRGALLGQGQAHGSVPNVRPPEVSSRPVWNSGQVLQQSSQGQYDRDQGGYGQSYGGQSYGGGQPYGGPQAPM